MTESELKLAAELIPGLLRLDEPTLTAFFATPTGVHIQNLIEALEASQQNKSWWQWLSDWHNTDFQQKLQDAKKVVAGLCAAPNQDYQNLINQQASQALRQYNTYFPLLQHPLRPNERPIIETLEGQRTTFPQLIPRLARSQVETILRLIFTEASMNIHYLDQIAIRDFNLKQADEISEFLIQEAESKDRVDYHQFLNQYFTNLRQFIIDQFTRIHGHNWQDEDDQPTLFESLTYMLVNSPRLNKINNSISQYATAHAFIQATGMSTQNEGSNLAIFDVYNYARYAGVISEVKFILSSLFKPFLPLYEEYRDIAHYEQNTYRILFRTLMPLIIMTVVTIGLMALIASLPLGLPELVFTIALVPALFVGLCAASAYVYSKNNSYTSIRNWYYGGAYQIPEFQINTRMIEAFSNRAIALTVRALYLELLQECDVVEANYQHLARASTLDTDQLEGRKKNQSLRFQLLLEWYDLHSNEKLGIDKLPALARKRLAGHGRRIHDQLQNQWQSEQVGIDPSLEERKTHLQAALTQLDQANQANRPIQTAISGNRHHFFTPSTSLLQLREKLGGLDRLHRDLAPLPSGG